MASTEYSEAYLNASRAWLIILLNVILLVLALGFSGLRLYTRIHLRPGTFGAEDWLLTSACAGLVLLVTTMILQTRYGAGKHIVTVSLQDIISYVEVFYFNLISYQLSLFLVKCTLIVQYIRIFGTSRPTRIACLVVLVFLSLYSTALLIASIIPCWPIYAFWDFGYQGKRTCIHMYPMWYTHAGLSISTDLVTLLIPVPVIWRLRLSPAHKVATIMLFGFGSLGIVGSILRVYQLHQLRQSTDATWTSVQSLWTTLEIAMFITCASVTGLKPFFDAKVSPAVSRMLPAAEALASAAAGPRTQPSWMRSVTRRLGRRSSGTVASRLPTLRLGTARGGFETLRPSGGEAEAGIARPGLARPGLAVPEQHELKELESRDGTEYGSHDGSTTTPERNLEMV